MSAPSLPAVNSRWRNKKLGRVGVIVRVGPEEQRWHGGLQRHVRDAWIFYRYSQPEGETGRTNERGRWLRDFLEAFEPVADEAVCA